MPEFIASTAFKIIAAVVLALVVLISIKSCTGSRQKAAQAQQDVRVGEATTATAIEAANVVIANAEENATVDELVAATVKEMDSAETPKASAASARRAICDIMPDSCQPATK